MIYLKNSWLLRILPVSSVALGLSIAPSVASASSITSSTPGDPVTPSVVDVFLTPDEDAVTFDVFVDVLYRSLQPRAHHSLPFCFPMFLLLSKLLSSPLHRVLYFQVPYSAATQLCGHLFQQLLEQGNDEETINLCDTTISIYWISMNL